MTCDLGIGIIGAGFIGRVHARAARLAGAKLVGIAEATEERAQAAAAELGGRGYAEAAELVADPEVDVVHVCTPNHLHAPLVEMALGARKHVICEKPLATSVEDAARLTQMAGEAQVVAAIPFAYRYYAMAQEARARVLNGSLGRVHLVHGSYLQDWLLFPTDGNWRVDKQVGGPSRAFADIGSHWCDFMEWTTGLRIAAVVALATTAVPQRVAGFDPTFQHDRSSEVVDGEMRAVETEDVACLLFRTEDNVPGTLTVSQVSAGRKNRLWIEIDGAEASVVFDQERPESLWIGRRSTNEVLPRDPALLSPEARRLCVLPAGHAQGFLDCFVAFLSDVYAAVANRAVARYPTFEDGLRTARITDAVLKSVNGGSWTAVVH
jgi:predicted dehydrogenase